MKKKTKQVEKQYIAININNDDTIAIGNKEDVAEFVVDYCYGEGWNKDDIENSIVIFELGGEVKFDIELDVKINF